MTPINTKKKHDNYNGALSHRLATVHATLSNYRQAPRKMRMVVNAIRGKKVSDVLVNLDFIAKKASLPIKTLIMSALANAKTLSIPTDNLIVKTIKVDSGKIMYRRLPAARGSAHPIRKRTSHLYVELSPQTENKRLEVIKTEIKTEKVVKSSPKPKSKK